MKRNRQRKGSGRPTGRAPAQRRSGRGHKRQTEANPCTAGRGAGARSAGGGQHMRARQAEERMQGVRSDRVLRGRHVCQLASRDPSCLAAKTLVPYYVYHPGPDRAGLRVLLHFYGYPAVLQGSAARAPRPRFHLATTLAGPPSQADSEACNSAWLRVASEPLHSRRPGGAGPGSGPPLAFKLGQFASGSGPTGGHFAAAAAALGGRAVRGQAPSAYQPECQ
jgi:hypothetical protein